jgi:hypothetical protein
MVSGSVFRAITTRDMNRSDTAGADFARTPIRADNESKNIMIMKPSKIRAHRRNAEIRYYVSALRARRAEATLIRPLNLRAKIKRLRLTYRYQLYVCVYIYTYVYTYIYTYIHIYIYRYIYLFISSNEICFT